TPPFLRKNEVMDFSLPAEDDPRRLSVRKWIRGHPQPTPAELAAEGYVVPEWPRPWGLDADPEEQLIIGQELSLAGIDQHGHNPIGIGWAGPTILAGGTEAQKARFLPPLVRGEEIWCQLFSEPGAGSDLAGLTTRAERDGDVYLVNGQKVWTTWAEDADYGILLARTGAARQKGITYFLCPMRQPGVTVRPIREMTGRTHFTEVFFDDARVPVDHVLGVENGGWPLAKLTLGNERVSLSSGGVLWGMGPTTSEVLAQAPRPLDPLQQQLAVELHIEAEIMRLMGLRVLSAQIAGRAPGPEAAVKKMLADRHGQMAMRFLRDAAGAEGLMNGDEASWGFLFSPALTIGGGTSQVLANIIGESILGLPRDN
ncbi:MAG: acyl-CoA dehydrogenase family protein, partial [Acidimicrobiia bacterium]